MKTSFTNFSQNKINMQARPAFSLNKLKTACCGGFLKDTFQKSKNIEIIKKVDIKDTSGNNHTGVIIKKTAKDCIAFEDCSLYEMYINGVKSGRITFSDEADMNGKIFVYGIAADYENSKNYKGIGTQLLKLAVEHSKNKGCKGQISLFADFIPEPTQFYYKNNLRASKTFNYLNHSRLEGILDFSVRNNISSDEFENFPNAFHMTLDKKGARALFKGERLYENMNSKTLYKKALNSKDGKTQTWIDFCDFSDRDKKPCYLIQAISEKRTEHGKIYNQIGAIEITPLSDNDFSRCKINTPSAITPDEVLNQNVEKELSNAAKLMTNFLNA